MAKFAFTLSVGLAACALAPLTAAGAPSKADVVAPCEEVKGEGHIGSLEKGTQRFQLRIDLTVGASGPQVLVSRETKAGGGLRVAGYRFQAQSVACETVPGGFVLQATGSSRFRLGPRDVRQGPEQVLVEERDGATTVTIASALSGEGPAVLDLPAGRFGAALGIAGVRGQLNRNSLHAL